MIFSAALLLGCSSPSSENTQVDREALDELDEVPVDPPAPTTGESVIVEPPPTLAIQDESTREAELAAINASARPLKEVFKGILARAKAPVVVEAEMEGSLSFVGDVAESHWKQVGVLYGSLPTSEFVVHQTLAGGEDHVCGRFAGSPVHSSLLFLDETKADDGTIVYSLLDTSKGWPAALSSTSDPDRFKWYMGGEVAREDVTLALEGF